MSCVAHFVTNSGVLLKCSMHEINLIVELSSFLVFLLSTVHISCILVLFLVGFELLKWAMSV